MKYALDLGIRTTELTIDARHLRELAHALHLVHDPDELAPLIRTFDSQKATIERLGPSTDYVHLQLLLCGAEWKYDSMAASHRLVDAYLWISAVKDVATKTACLARLLDLFDVVDPGRAVRQREGLDQLAESEFAAGLQELLLSTADHDFATRDIITALVRHLPGRAIDVAASLNTELRRDEALTALAGRLVDAPLEEVDFSVVDRLLSSFADPDRAEKAIASVIERLSNVTSCATLLGYRDLIRKMASRIGQFRDRELKVRVASQSLATLLKLKDPSLASFLEHLKSQMRAAWIDLDLDESKLKLAFFVAGNLAPVDRSAAEEYIQLADGLRARNAVTTAASNSRMCLHIAVRAYGGMLARGVASETDVKELASRIALLRSQLDRVIVWADVALKQITHGESQAGKEYRR